MTRIPGGGFQTIGSGSFFDLTPAEAIAGATADPATVHRVLASPNLAGGFQSPEQQAEREAATQRQQYQDLIAQQNRLEQRKGSMNPAAYVRQAAGVEYDLANFQSGMNEDFARQRNMRLASRDLSTALSEYRKGGIDESQLAQITESMKREYGPDTLVHLPEWRQINDLEGEYQQGIQAQRQQRATELGIPVEKTRWDGRTGRAALDEEAFFVDRYQAEQAAKVAKPINAAKKDGVTLFKGQYDARMDIHERRLDAMMKSANTPQDKETAFNIYKELAGREWDQYQANVRTLGQQAEELVKGGAEPAEQPQLSHPKLPAGGRISGSYSTPNEMVAAKPRPGTYVIGDGSLFYINTNGRPTLVQ